MERGPQQQRTIREWEVVESLAHEEKTIQVGRKEIKIVADLEVKRPVFSDDRKGRPVLGLKLTKDRWSFRFNIYKDGDEVSEAISVMQAVLGQKEKGLSIVSRLTHEMDAERDQRIADHERSSDKFKKGGGDSKAGSGLGRWSKPGKTKRDRDKHKGEHRDER